MEGAAPGGLPKPPVGSPLPRLTGDGPIFRANGQPWRYVGVTAFKLLELVRQGQDIRPFLRYYRALGCTAARMLANKPAVPGLDPGWDTPPLAVLQETYQILQSEGFYGETVLFGSAVDRGFVPAWLDALAALPHALCEVCNEPGHQGQYRTADLPRFSAPGLLLASGDYDPPQPWYGSYLTYHSQRVADPYEAARKAKGVVDLYGGWSDAGGSFAGAHGPVVGDEPGKPSDFGYQADAVLAHYAIYGLLGAGGTIHTLSGQFGQLPRDSERPCVEAAARGLTAFPPDAPLGGYRHDQADEAATGSLRTYRSGPYGVRVRPTSGAPILIGV